MVERNERASHSAGGRIPAGASARRTALGIAAALIAAGAILGAAFSLRHVGPERWVHVSIYVALLAMLGVMVILLRQNDAVTIAVEHANTGLAEAVARAQVAQQRAEALAKQKAQLAALLDSALSSAPVAFAFFDHDLRFLRVNQTFADLLGEAPEDHIGARLSEIHPELGAHIEPRMRDVLDARRPLTSVEDRIATGRGKGDARSFLSSYYPIITGDGSLFGIGMAVVDVTEFKTLEEQLLQAQKMEAVGRLAGGVAHDFNNLLTVISSYTELILYDRPAEFQEELSEIRGATRRAAKLTRQLLAFSRRQAMEPRIVNPNDVVRGVESMIRRLLDTNITITCRLNQETPLIRVDPGQLEQVVMNLAINAADAMPDGGVLSIETAGARLDRHNTRDPEIVEGEYALVRVEDTGHGMDEATIAQIFEPFFTTKEPGRGTGLGLSTVYGIVKQSGGTVSVESTPGMGSRFNVFLPATDTSA